MPYNTDQRPVTKTVTKTPMTNPGENLKVKLGDAGKYEYLRVFFGGPKGETPYEAVLHRPIGITPLDDDEWVFSSPGNYALLLKREKNPAEADLRANVKAHMLKEAAAQGLITLGADNVLFYAKNVDRNDFLKKFKDEVKEMTKVANKAILDWKAKADKDRPAIPPNKIDFKAELIKKLEIVNNDETKAELAFSKFMEKDSTIQAAEKANPATYETLGGSFAETKQVSIPGAKGKGIGEIQQHFARQLEDVFKGKNSVKNPALTKATPVP